MSISAEEKLLKDLESAVDQEAADKVSFLKGFIYGVGFGQGIHEKKPDEMDLICAFVDQIVNEEIKKSSN